jgi:hypothetical protein
MKSIMGETVESSHNILFISLKVVGSVRISKNADDPWIDPYPTLIKTHLLLNSFEN